MKKRIKIEMIDIVGVKYSPSLFENCPDICIFLATRGDEITLNLIRDYKDGTLLAERRDTLRTERFSYDEVFIIVPEFLLDIYTDLEVIRRFDFKIPFSIEE